MNGINNFKTTKKGFYVILMSLIILHINMTLLTTCVFLYVIMYYMAV